MTDHEHPDDQIEWPREIWMGEREEHDQGIVTAVLSEWATVARWEGDKERDREFHRYVDADIHESAERYYKARIAAAEAAAYRKAAETCADIADGFRIMAEQKDTDPNRAKAIASAVSYAGNSILALADTSALDEALAAEREKCAAALTWAYSGDGLDDCALAAQAILHPLTEPKAPDHMVQIAIRVVIDRIRERAAIRKGDQA